MYTYISQVMIWYDLLCNKPCLDGILPSSVSNLRGDYHNPLPAKLVHTQKINLRRLVYLFENFTCAAMYGHLLLSCMMSPGPFNYGPPQLLHAWSRTLALPYRSTQLNDICHDIGENINWMALPRSLFMHRAYLHDHPLEAHSIENETFCSKLKLDLDIFSAYFCHMQ